MYLATNSRQSGLPSQGRTAEQLSVVHHSRLSCLSEDIPSLQLSLLAFVANFITNVLELEKDEVAVESDISLKFSLGSLNAQGH